jgi:hypothetical protein
MPKRTEAISFSHWWERLAFSAFFCGALWSGHTLLTQWEPPRRSPESVAGMERQIGASWVEARGFESVEPVDYLESAQSKLDSRLAYVQARPLGLLRTSKVIVPLTAELDRLEDYIVRPGKPLPGAVIKLRLDPKCLEFTWSEIPLPGIRYTVELAKNRDFAHFRSFGSPKNSVRIRVSRKADLFWRVRAHWGRQESVSPVSSYLILEPALTPEDEKMREIATRVRQSTAWLSDISFCD